MKTSKMAATVVLLLSAGQCLMAADGFVNGSFEDNGAIGDLRVKAPDGWDVNVPAGKFSCRVQVGWPTEGYYCLALRTNWFIEFSGGEMAAVSQMLVLDDVEKIVFDLTLRTSNGSKWDPNVCRAVVVIDDDVVWQMASGSDVRGSYPDQAYRVGNKFRDGQPHRVSLALKMNVSGMQFEIYESFWDNLRTTPSSDGGGSFPGDFNHDGYVEYGDLAMMADMWMAEVPPQSEYNLSAIDDGDLGGLVNFFDLAVLGGDWLSGSVQE